MFGVFSADLTTIAGASAFFVPIILLVVLKVTNKSVRGNKVSGKHVLVSTGEIS